MANELSTAGVTVGFAIASSRPSSGYQRIPGVKSTPGLNPEPTSQQVTTLEDTEYHRYIRILKDPSGALPITCNNTNEVQAAWYTLCKLAENSKAWFVINIPGLSKAFYFSAEPSLLGVLGMDVDTVAEITAYITPTGIAGWQNKPTKPAVYITPITTQELTSDGSPITLTPVLDNEDAVINSVSSSNTGVATVTKNGANVVITYVGPGQCDITVATDAGTNYSVGKTIIRVEST
jgi:hypothetical protein